MVFCFKCYTVICHISGDGTTLWTTLLSDLIFSCNFMYRSLLNTCTQLQVSSASRY